MLKLLSYLPIQKSSIIQRLCLISDSMFNVFKTNLLLVDPVVLGTLPALDLTLLEPESNLLLCILDGVRAVTDIASDYFESPKVSS